VQREREGEREVRSGIQQPESEVQLVIPLSCSTPSSSAVSGAFAAAVVSVSSGSKVVHVAAVIMDDDE
jgi:hypothetical protein